MKIETVMLNEARNVTLTAYLQSVSGEFGNIPRRPAMLVLPGGSYSMCSDREADPVALAYLRAGFQTFVLRYSVGSGIDWPQPLQDYEQAMAMIRSRAEDWNLYPDKVAVVGFSAGGHLAAAAATLAKHKPDAAVLGYAVTEEGLAKACLPSAPDLVSQVGMDTCPCFVFATRTDNVVPVRNSLRFALALEAHGVMFEVHIYAYGPHGFSVCDSTVLAPGAGIPARAARWVEDSVAWLQDVLGDFGNGSLTAPRCARRINDDCEPYCSVDCTMERLLNNPQARAVLTPLLESAQSAMAQKYGAQISGMRQSAAAKMGSDMTLRSALAYGNVPEDTVAQLDLALRKIPNLTK